MKTSPKSFFSALDERSRRLNVILSQEEEQTKLRIETDCNEPGVLFRIAGVLFAHHLLIRRAHITSSGHKTISDEFFVQKEDDSSIQEKEVKEMIGELEGLLFANHSVLEFLSNKGINIPPPSHKSAGEVTVYVDEKKIIIDINGITGPGYLLLISRAFYLTDVNILEAILYLDRDGSTQNRFFVDPSDIRFHNKGFCENLIAEMKDLL